jgi:lipid A 3-O-deacylase
LRARGAARFVLAALIGAASGTAVGQSSLADLQVRTTMNLRIDNDSFAGSDRGYTNGIKIGFTSSTVEDFQDPRLSPRLRWLNRRLEWLQPRGYEQNNVTLEFGQGMFTPEDWSRREPDPLDRPYAGVLALGLTYNGRDALSMRTTTLTIGLVGPSAGAEQVQDSVHDWIGGNEFLGWNHQLRDEPVFRIQHQRLRKWSPTLTAPMADAIVHYGGSVGNLATFANAGFEVRFGGRLPDDFGSAPTLPVAENTAPSSGPSYARRSSIHGFLALDARYVLHDITLDGNTWRDSPSVERRDLVADIGVGFAMYWQAWTITFARYFRTKEFETQREDTKLGSITIRRTL